MSPLGPVEVFSRTRFAVATPPKSQPARVYGTHGAGVVLGWPLSALTMLGSASSGGVLSESTRSVQYLNDGAEAVVPSSLK
jgi:hypothetical protein